MSSPVTSGQTYVQSCDLSTDRFMSSPVIMDRFMSSSVKPQTDFVQSCHLRIDFMSSLDFFYFMINDKQSSIMKLKIFL